MSPPRNANPGAGGARVHGISSSNDAAPNTRNQPSTQANAVIAARAILTAALKRDIHVGTDGDELVLIAPLRVPRNVRRWFEHWIDQFRDEVVAIISAQEDRFAPFDAGGRSTPRTD